MRAKRLIWMVVLLSGLTGCSAISDFGGYMFGDAVDSGMTDSGVDSGPVDSGPPVDSGTPDADGGPADSATDAPVDAPMDTMLGPRPPTATLQTGGGAIISTPSYQLRVSIGAPQPMGSRSTATEDITLGPGSL